MTIVWLALALQLVLAASAGVLVPVYIAQKKREILLDWARDLGWNENVDKTAWNEFLVALFGGGELSQVWMPMSGLRGGHQYWAMEFWPILRSPGPHGGRRIRLRPRTVVAVELLRSLPSLEITSTDLDERVMVDVAGAPLVFGHQQLDQMYRVRCDDLGFVRHLMSLRAVLRLSALQPRTNLVLMGNWLIAWEPSSAAPDVLDRMLDVAGWMTERIRDLGTG